MRATHLTPSPPHPLTPLLLLAAGLLFSAAGCPRFGGSDKPKYPPGTTIRLLVVGDPALAAAIDQLWGEWNDQTSTSFEIEQAAKLDLRAAGPPQADAVISASSDVAVMAHKKWIVEMPEELIRGKQPSDAGRSADAESGQEPGAWSDIFTPLRAHEAVWDKKVVAVPFGSPVLVCYCRADLLDGLHAKPPQTWAEYQKLAERLADRKQLGPAAPPAGRPWSGSLEPLGPGWAGMVLLARAAPYVVNRSNYSGLFSIESMQPLVDGPPFVRALKELVAAAKLGPPAQLTYDPTAVRRAFWRGECGLALCWPSAADKDCAKPGPEFRVSLAELPGSPEAYNVFAAKWERRQAGEDGRVPLLGVAGRSGAVTSGSQWPDLSFRLLLWLSDRQWTQQTSAASPATTLFRKTDVPKAGAWVEAAMPPDVAAQYGQVAQRALSRQERLFALRIPGREEYLQALDEAVWNAVRGRQSPEEALKEAASRWREITRRYGVEDQRAAYRRGLGL